jgi:hypothetical protein
MTQTNVMTQTDLLFPAVKKWLSFIRHMAIPVAVKAKANRNISPDAIFSFPLSRMREESSICQVIEDHIFCRDVRLCG